MSKCSEASVLEEDRHQHNFDKLVETVESIAKTSTKISRKKPLKKKASGRQKRIGSKDVAKIVKIVVETVQPEGDESENLKLINDATKELKEHMMKKTELTEALQSLIDHYQTVDSPEIKRSLLAELSKHLSLTIIRKHVKEKITNYQ